MQIKRSNFGIQGVCYGLELSLLRIPGNHSYRFQSFSDGLALSSCSQKVLLGPSSTFLELLDEANDNQLN